MSRSSNDDEAGRGDGPRAQATRRETEIGRLRAEIGRLRTEIAGLAEAAAERERASEERFRSVVENMSEGLMMFDPAGNLIFQNRASLRIHGFPKGDSGRIGHEELPATWNAWDDAGRPIGFEQWPVSRVFRHERFENQVLHVQRAETAQEFYGSYNGCPIFDSDGRFVLGFITIRDITLETLAHRRLDDAVRTAELSLGQLRAVIDSMSEAVIIADLDGNVLTMNLEALRLHGLSDVGESQRHRRPFADRFELRTLDGGLLPVDRWPLARILCGEQVIGLEVEVRDLRSGKVAYRSYSGRPVRNGAGEPILAALTVRDVTRERAAARALVEANERLQDADRRKDEFLGMLSHELRNPLAPIWNSLFVLEHADPAGERARHAREVVTRQVGTLSRLVDDLLDVTRIVRNRIELRKSDIDLAELLERICGDYRSIMEARRLTLCCPLVRRVFVHGDQARLSQVVGNLLHNAAKFTPPGGRIDLELDEDGADAVLRVRDNGSGIERALLAEVFEPFTQARQTLARSEGGLGLGLALVKGLVELHGGRAEVRSEGSGRGAEFTIRLPRLCRAAPAAPARTAHAPASSRRRVLVVDDNIDAAESMGELVRFLGHDADLAFDGTQALLKIEAAPPDVVLCDIGLPGLSGYDVARAVRAAGHTSRLIAVSGYAQPDDLARSGEAGFEAHIAKPADPERIRELLG